MKKFVDPKVISKDLIKKNGTSCMAAYLLETNNVCPVANYLS